VYPTLFGIPGIYIAPALKRCLDSFGVAVIMTNNLEVYADAD
jgi:hypothetical protein